METYKGKHEKAKEKPLVMVVKSTKKGTSMIIGVMDYNRSSNYIKKYQQIKFLIFIVISGKSLEQLQRKQALEPSTMVLTQQWLR